MEEEEEEENDATISIGILTERLLFGIIQIKQIYNDSTYIICIV